MPIQMEVVGVGEMAHSKADELKVDELLTKTDSRYTLVILAARRARQINNYFNSSKRGEIPQAVGPQVEPSSRNPLTVALKEIKDGKVTYERIADGIK